MRLPDWPERLGEYLEAVRAKPFRYGARSHDCGVFAAGVVQAVRGEDALSEFGAYRGAKQALAIVEREGGMIDLVAKRFEKIAPSFARRGDLGLIAAPGLTPSLTLCVVLGDTLAAPGKAGLEILPRSLLLHAFKV